ncbi:MAG: hypothetical protein WBG32_09310 [Nodosilinea sp.]
MAQAWKLAASSLGGYTIPALERLMAPWRDHPIQLRDMDQGACGTARQL